MFLQFVCNQGNHSVVKTINLFLQWYNIIHMWIIVVILWEVCLCTVQLCNPLVMLRVQSSMEVLVTVSLIHLPRLIIRTHNTCMSAYKYTNHLRYPTWCIPGAYELPRREGGWTSVPILCQITLQNAPYMDYKLLVLITFEVTAVTSMDSQEPACCDDGHLSAGFLTK